MTGGRGVNAVDITAKAHYDALPFARVRPAPRSLHVWFAAGTLAGVVLGSGCAAGAVAVAHHRHAGSDVQTVTVAPSASVCERALLANLDVAQRADAAFLRGDRKTGMALYVGQTAALPEGCP